jgi:acetyl-CoA carboxylase biotin carboxyl carrier protein
MPGLADQIPFLSRCLQGTDIELLELTNGPESVRLRRDGETVSSVAEVKPEAVEIKAPSLGVFRRVHPLQAAPLAQTGQHLAKGDPVGLLQVGALLIHVASPADGIVLDVLAADGAAVGYGTALVRIVRGKE